MCSLKKIHTSRFGEIEIDENLLFDFISPIIGYNDKKYFALIDYKQDSPFKWLQSTQDPDLAFAVTLCAYFKIDYKFELSDADAQILDIKSADEILAVNIVNIPQENPKAATINMLAPIIINTSNNKAMQVILKDQNFEIKYPLFKEDEEKAAD